MTYEDFAYARQLLAEERLGRNVRQVQAQEDDDFTAAVRALGG